ncbi:hypothetical protein ETD83_10760 [Actinomadura soli]|uniref:Uncharacterized protein n=1 Tax=Actinomadura soli TaxID=2508997 RepID=A0A5C4JEI3_9ACTN|nr:hypothetical protein [Actinomadura soli]TMR03381.1 hypothetical protein ETD83_10760 [Actinomadura soli]
MNTSPEALTAALAALGVDPAEHVTDPMGGTAEPVGDRFRAVHLAALLARAATEAAYQEAYRLASGSIGDWFEANKAASPQQYSLTVEERSWAAVGYQVWLARERLMELLGESEDPLLEAAENTLSTGMVMLGIRPEHGIDVPQFVDRLETILGLISKAAAARP